MSSIVHYSRTGVKYIIPIVDIAAGLLEMRRAGVLKRLYIDRGVIRIGTGGYLARVEVWEAVKLIEAFRAQRKPIRGGRWLGEGSEEGLNDSSEGT